MPQRTNPFQKALYLAKKILMPGSEVIESAMLPDNVTGLEREVDILITGQVPGFEEPIRIGIECRDHKKRQGTDWIEQIHGKHQLLPIDISVAASTSGFSKPARDIAARYKVQLWEPSTPDEDVEREIVGVLEALWSKAVTFSIDDVVVTEVALEDDNGTPVPEFLQPLSRDVLDEQGYLLGDVRSLVQTILFSGENMNNEMIRDARTGPLEIKGSIDIDSLDRPNSSSTAVYTFSVDRPERRFRIRSLAFEIKAQLEVTKVPLRHQKIENFGLAYGEANVAGQPVTVVAVEIDGQPATVTSEPTKPLKGG